MSEPTTPTGKQALELGLAGPIVIERIEREAAAAERERIVAETEGHHRRAHRGDWAVCASAVCCGVRILSMGRWLLADPEP